MAQLIDPCEVPGLLKVGRPRLPASKCVADLLRGLRRAQAEAVTNQVQMAMDVAEIQSQVGSCATTPRGGMTPAAGGLGRDEGIFPEDGAWRR